MKDITLLIAHPDDEALFLWPFLSRVKRIVCASSDQFNPERDWCKERGQCLQEVGALLGCDVKVLPHASEFYRLPTRGGELKSHANVLMDELRSAEIIATHNAWGEYGHLDHILCHHIARTLHAQTKCDILVTDIAQEINWLPVRPWGQAPYAHGFPFKNEIDRPLFERIKVIYDARGCWTWSWEPQGTCGVYLL